MMNRGSPILGHIHISSYFDIVLLSCSQLFKAWVFLAGTHTATGRQKVKEKMDKNGKDQE
jgi:hypothetical protein